MPLPGGCKAEKRMCLCGVTGTAERPHVRTKCPCIDTILVASLSESDAPKKRGPSSLKGTTELDLIGNKSRVGEVTTPLDSRDYKPTEALKPRPAPKKRSTTKVRLKGFLVSGTGNESQSCQHVGQDQAATMGSYVAACSRTDSASTQRSIHLGRTGFLRFFF